MDPPELRRVAELFERGLVAKDRADACLRRWQELRRAGRDVSLLDVLVEAKLLTRTQALVLGRADLTRIQPFRNYRLLRYVGEGGMALVYEATYLKIAGARVALKILDPAYGLDERFRLRFKREANILLNLDHENIVEGKEHGSEDGVDFYAMGFVDGVSVQHLLDRGLALPESLCVRIVVQVASALGHMAEKGIVHRDVKPGNFILDPKAHVRIIDFGLAKVMTGMWSDTKDATTVGTVEYMSPEQALGRADVDARADVYALGVSLYQMLCGRLPFRGSPDEIMYGHVKLEVEFPPDVRARVSPPVQYVIRRMMAKSPEERYPSGGAAVEEMERICAAVLARPFEVPAEVHVDAIESAPIPARPAAPVPVRPAHRAPVRGIPGRGSPIPGRGPSGRGDRGRGDGRPGKPGRPGRPG